DFSLATAAWDKVADIGTGPPWLKLCAETRQTGDEDRGAPTFPAPAGTCPLHATVAGWQGQPTGVTSPSRGLCVRGPPSSPGIRTAVDVSRYRWDPESAASGTKSEHGTPRCSGRPSHPCGIRGARSSQAVDVPRPTLGACPAASSRAVRQERDTVR